jgi:MFS transporter, FHS family, glucose/mannose:H+ symporter
MTLEHGVRRPLIAGIVFAASVLSALYMGAMGVVLPALGATFDLGTSVQGRLFPASFGGSVAGVLLGGWLSDHFGRKPVILLCLSIAIVGHIVFGMAGVFSAILLASLLIGAGGAGAQTVSNVLLADVFPERRAIFLNGTQVAFGVGAILGPALMQRMASIEGGWRPFYFGMAASYALILLLLAFQRLPSHTRHRGVDPRRETGVVQEVSPLRNRVLLLLCATAFLYSGAEVALFSWMPTYLLTLPGGAFWSGIVVSVFWIAMTIGRALTGLLLTRIPLPRLRFLLSTSATLCGAATLLLSSPPLLVVGVGLTGLCFSGTFSVLLAETSERFPRTAGTAIGLMVAMSGAGCAFEPYIVGLLRAAGFSWPVALSVVPAASLFVVLLAIISMKETSRGVSQSIRGTAESIPCAVPGDTL